MYDETIDLAALRRLLNVIGGNLDDFAELVDEYVAGAPDLAAEMRKAADANNWETVWRTAHTLKSNARDFGAVHLAALCANLENETRKGNVEAPGPIISEIELAEAAARRTLQKICADKLLG